MKLTDVRIHKYKSFTQDQHFNLNDDITILVGMNESGKTSALETIAKTRYFQDDKDFEFNLTHDYPRREKKKMGKSGAHLKAIECTYEIDGDTLYSIEDDLGEGVLKSKQVTIPYFYNTKNEDWESLEIDQNEFLTNKIKNLGIYSESLIEKLKEVDDVTSLKQLVNDFKDEKYKNGLSSLEKYFENKWGWDIPLYEYVAREHIEPALPKFLYYDEYYALPSRISIEKLQSKQLQGNDYKTARALFELADIETEEILNANNFEDFVAELEATQAIISDELFKYWNTNKNLQISFQIDKRSEPNNHGGSRIVEHILDIRVSNKGVSLPLKNRSKGFNWFFSFLVWFKKIQEDESSNYILLLDEPGLNLHASAQADLMGFLEDLSEDYQIIYTTHSPFMIPSGKLDRVRTVLETNKGSIISDSVQEKDPNTLFPLQAALGYDIAQNLFVSKKNLLVEGVSDLMILTAMSGVLEAEGKTGLRSDVTIVPTGGLEKVATFISLLRGSKLEIACLLDSYTNPKGKAKMDELIKDKIIQKNKIRFFDKYLDDKDTADLEDLFVKEDYLKLFNSAFAEYNDVKESDLNTNIPKIITQINQYLKLDRFNHYRPANELIKQAPTASSFNKGTLDTFEKVFEDLNKLLD